MKSNRFRCSRKRFLPLSVADTAEPKSCSKATSGDPWKGSSLPGPTAVIPGYMVPPYPLPRALPLTASATWLKGAGLSLASSASAVARTTVPASNSPPVMYAAIMPK